MQIFLSYFKNSAFFQRRAGEPPYSERLKVNFLKTFAKKNILYTSPFPVIKVPTTGAGTDQRQAAALREKILYSTWTKSGGPLLQRKWAFDGTVRSIAVAETLFDMKQRCVLVRRYNPLFCFWQMSNDAEPRVLAFWAVFPITKAEAKRRYGVEPTTDLLTDTLRNEDMLKHIDGQEWFSRAIRWDGETRTAWIGNKMSEAPHRHLMGTIPTDVCMPFDDDEGNGQRGSFYLEPLIKLQAELNDTLWRRSNVVRRMANPAIWARGVTQNAALDEFKNAMQSGTGGGLLQLSKDGDTGIMQLNDTSMLDNHAKELLEHMQRIAGFSAATFGESVGANTSGDALGMYFTPTQKLIDDENIAWKAFYQSINAKILNAYERFALPSDKFKFSGYAPKGTLLPVTDEAGDQKSLQYSSGAFSETLSGDQVKEIINGNHNSIIQPPAVTPKNEIELKRFWKEAAHEKFVSRTTAYEQIELESPEEEIALLSQEQGDPLLNPEGTNKILEGMMPPAASPQPTIPAGTGV